MIRDTEEQPDFERAFAQTVVFYYKSPTQHLREIASRPVAIAHYCLTALGIYSLLWWVPATFFNVRTLGWMPCLSVAGLSLASGIGWRVYKYRGEVPPGMEPCNATAQTLAHLRPVMWEYKLAKSILAEKLAPLDKECRSLAAGTTYVPSRQSPDVPAYVDWLHTRSKDLLRLLDVFNEVLIGEFPVKVCSTQEAESKPVEILEACESVVEFFRATVELEREGRAVHPPEGWEHIHTLQLGWAEPFRDATMQLFGHLQRISEVDPQGNEALTLYVDLGEIPNLQEFQHEFAVNLRNLGID